MKRKMEAGETREYILRVSCKKESDGNFGGKFSAKLIAPNGKRVGRSKCYSTYSAANKALADAELRRNI